MKDDKRQEVISWDGYFMGLAAIASFRSKDPNTQNGTCIVQEDSPVALGYNGFPRGCSDDDFPWCRGVEKKSYESKYSYSEHSERNAIYDAARRGVSLKGSKLYLYSEKGYYLCDECARAIIQAGIKEVIMAFAIAGNTDKYDWTATKRMFNSSGINVRTINMSLAKDLGLISGKFVEIHKVLMSLENISL